MFHYLHACTVPLLLLITTWLFYILASLAPSATGSAVSGLQRQYEWYCLLQALVALELPWSCPGSSLCAVKHFFPFTRLAMSCFSRLFRLRKTALQKTPLLFSNIFLLNPFGSYTGYIVAVKVSTLSRARFSPRLSLIAFITSVSVLCIFAVLIKIEPCSKVPICYAEQLWWRKWNGLPGSKSFNSCSPSLQLWGMKPVQHTEAPGLWFTWANCRNFTAVLILSLITRCSLLVQSRECHLPKARICPFCQHKGLYAEPSQAHLTQGYA